MNHKQGRSSSDYEAVQDVHELGFQRLRRLRKRHSLAKKAATASTLCGPTSQILANHEMENDWQSDDDVDAHVHIQQQPMRMTRARRQSSNHKRYAPLTPPMKRMSRAAPSANRGLSAKDDQKWIGLLERNNEELLSQIETLTSDSSDIEKNLKAQLEAAKNEVLVLKEQLSEKERLYRTASEHYEAKIQFLRSMRTDSPSGTTQKYDLRWRGHSLSDFDIRKLIQERDLLRSRAKSSETELLKYKRRNAALAEQILQKRGLEM